MENKKNQKIINLRALAILLVVFGHSIILYSSSWNLYSTERNCAILDIIKNIINIIQMPLFFSISGYLFYYSYKKRNLKELFVEKFKRLIIPFLIISIFWMVPIRMLLHYSGYANLSFGEIIINKIFLGQDAGHMWFLPTLFCIFIIMKIALTILEKTKSKIQYYILTGILAIIGIFIFMKLNNMVRQHYLYLNYVMNNFIYFYLGFWINKYKIEDLIHNKKFLKIILVIFNVIGITICITKNNLLLQKIIELSTVTMLYVIMTDIINKGINILSENSFGVYLFHSPLIYITFTYFNNASPIFVVALNFIVWGAISLAISIMLRKTKLKFIVGER